jgi:hypothetical protein
MSAFSIQVVFLAAGAAYFGWTAAGALRSGEISIVYGGLDALRGGNQTHALLRCDSALTIALLIPVAWHIGGLAGYR